MILYEWLDDIWCCKGIVTIPDIAEGILIIFDIAEGDMKKNVRV